MDEPLQEVNIYDDFDDEEDFTYKGGVRSQQIQTQFQNQKFPRVSIRTVPIVNPEETHLINWASEPDEVSSQEEPIEEDFSYQLFPVQEESVEEESSQEDEPVVEETEWTIHSERLKRSTYDVIINPILGLLNEDGSIDAGNLPELHEELDNAITFLVNIHVYNIDNHPESENETILPPYNYADSNYQHNLDYIIELLKETDDRLLFDRNWVDDNLITNRMVARLSYHYGFQHSEREGETLRYFHTEITNQAAPEFETAPLTDFFNPTVEVDDLKVLYESGNFDKKDKIPENSQFIEKLTDLITYNRDNFKKLHNYIRESRDYLLEFNEEEDQEDIKLLNIFDREMDRVITMDRRNQYLKLIQELADLSSQRQTLFASLRELTTKGFKLYDNLKNETDEDKKKELNLDSKQISKQLSDLNKRIYDVNEEFNKKNKTMKMSEFYVKEQPKQPEQQIWSFGGGRKKIKNIIKGSGKFIHKSNKIERVEPNELEEQRQREREERQRIEEDARRQDEEEEIIDQLQQEFEDEMSAGSKKIKSKRKRKLNKSKKKQHGGKKFVSKNRKKANKNR